MKVIWIGGEPCIGKTTLINALLPEARTYDQHITRGGEWAALGRYQNAPIDAPPPTLATGHALASWRANPTRYLLVEANLLLMASSFTQAVADLSQRMVLLEGQELAVERRWLRRVEPAAKYIRARRKHAEAFARALPWPVAKIHPDVPPVRLAEVVRLFLDGPFLGG